MFIRNLLTLVVSILLPVEVFPQEIFRSDYIGLAVPQHYPGEFEYYDSTLRTLIVKSNSEVKHDNTLLPSFPNVVSNVTVYSVDDEGGLELFGAGISVANSTYEVFYDFTQTQTITELADNGSTKSALIGVGVRMVAKVRTKKKGFSLTSPFGLTANSKKIKGSLEVRVIGIGSQKINDLIPTTTDLSAASISVALQAVASIKSHIYDEETVVIPQYIAYNLVDRTEVSGSPSRTSVEKSN